MGEMVVLWLLAFASVVGIGFWRIEVNTRALRDVQEFMKKKALDAETIRASMGAGAGARAVHERQSPQRLRGTLPYVGFDEDPPSEPRRESSSKTLASTVEPPPAIEIVEVPAEDDDLDDLDDLDEKTAVDARPQNWEGNDDEFFERKTTEMVMSEDQTLGILCYVEERMPGG